MRIDEDNATDSPQESPVLPTMDAASSANPFVEEATRLSATARVTTPPERALKVRRTAADTPPPVIETDGPPGRPRRTWPWVLVIILILGVVGTAYFVLAGRDSEEPQSVPVPKVVGLTETQAAAKIRAAGFQYVKEGSQPSSEVAQGVVTRQEPLASEKLEKGRTVGYWVSTGSGLVAVPDVIGMAQDAATAELVASGLEVEANTEVNGTKPVGTVLRQNPEGAKQVYPGTAVTITVSAAANTVMVPLLSGMSKDNAIAALGSMQLKATIKPVASQRPGGTVVGQSPSAGTGVAPGTSITLEVSNSEVARTIMVPAVAALGLTQAEAKAQLSQYGLKVKVVSQETPDFKPGLCIYQHPAAGVQVKIGSTVTITISRKPTTTTVTGTPPGSTP
jgi:eukaryotic-like serine/threonine-protein kinase